MFPLYDWLIVTETWDGGTFTEEEPVNPESVDAFFSMKPKGPYSATTQNTQGQMSSVGSEKQQQSAGAQKEERPAEGSSSAGKQRIRQSTDSQRELDSEGSLNRHIADPQATDQGGLHDGVQGGQEESTTDPPKEEPLPAQEEPPPAQEEPQEPAPTEQKSDSAHLDGTRAQQQLDSTQEEEKQLSTDAEVDALLQEDLGLPTEPKPPVSTPPEESQPAGDTASDAADKDDDDSPLPDAKEEASNSPGLIKAY